MSGMLGAWGRRSITNPENPAMPLTSKTLANLLVGPTEAGEQVNEDTALKHNAVWRALSVVSNLSGALPLHTYERGTKTRIDSLMDDPHPDLTSLEWKRLTAVHRGMFGNFYGQKIRDGGGNVEWVFPMNPGRVTPGKARPIPENPSGKVFKVTADNGTVVEMTPNEILHIPGLGYDGISGVSMVKYAARGIALGLAAERHGAKLFESGNLLSGLLKTPGRLDQTQADFLQEQWRRKMSSSESAHSVAVLDSGADFQSLTMPNDDAQLLQLREFSVVDMGRRWGVPPFLMHATEKSTSWGTGLEQQMTGFVVVDLAPAWLQPTEARINKELLRPLSQECRYAVQGLMRGDAKTRAEYYRAMRELGVFNADDIRDLEDMPPLADGIGQIYLQPLNFGPLGTMPNTDGGANDATP